MKDILLPAFGETDFTETAENANARLIVLRDATDETFRDYCALLEREGCTRRESYETSAVHFAAFEGDKTGYFLTYFPRIGEMNVIVERDCAYFSYRNNTRALALPTLVTQPELVDFGLCYVIRLSDGRFIVFDGGRDFEPDRKTLYECLVAQSPDEKPVIAMWVLTHPHTDHFHCFLGFADEYGDKVVVESFLLNFPDANDLVHYPKLTHTHPHIGDTSGPTNIPRMWERIERLGAVAYMAHTGQRYEVGNAKLEILSCQDDTITRATSINASSVVIRMELEGQVILWTADVSFSVARLSERYGEYLKADILQVPHHGFQSGTPEAEIAGYDLIRPRVCLHPANDITAFTSFCTYRRATRYLMCAPYVEEWITGNPTRTLQMPYAPKEGTKEKLNRMVLGGIKNSGGCAWIFTGLSTAREEDFRFTFVNMTYLPTTVNLRIVFEDRARNIDGIRVELKPLCVKTLNIVGEEANTDAGYCNGGALKLRGIPENAPFAIQFLSEAPVVISHEHHTPAYHTSGNELH